MKILCSNERCSTRDRVEKMLLNEKDLLLIGDSYKCPYCRGYNFILIK
jgi:hypothetical protein